MADKALHTWTTSDGLPIVTRWSVADAAARAALTTSSTPAVAVGGICYQQDVAKFYVCTAITPSIVWMQIADASYTVNDQTGTSYTLQLSDAGKLVTLNNASAVGVSIPANATVAFPIGTIISFLQKGAGQVTFSITSDTLQSRYTLKTGGQWANVTLTKISSTVWVLSGDVAIS